MIRRLLLALPILFLGWIATLALVMRLGGEAPAAFVPFPPASLLAALPGDVAVTGRSPVSLTLRSEGPDLTARLYAAGAWLVLPAGLEACIPGFLRQPVPQG
ncbi:hypothetical protein [Pararhodobacter aggregans]|uniref:Uncharacterized protein n=1 Tax=Pararhodobacter aggregans TaxID=404875 RepID=A0A2T7UNN4_9RHOB|nr:hypothetical protein [Pararhodobacter aggregans]PTX00690.1 hypothetical protein C8N33_10932 [Pararhodobacter aggregans]PVE46231.1 hypothetical protein DDE23_16405 [Pararhodobacter aggregans]